MTQGYLDQWLICGEFFSDRGWSTLDEDYLFGEAKTNPVKGSRSFGKPWIEYDTSDNYLQFLFAPFKHTLFVAGYAHTYVYSPKDMQAILLCGSDDGIKVWLNGDVVWRNDTNRACNPGDDKASVHLKTGWNSMLVKVRQGMAHWQFVAQILDETGNEIPGLTCSREAQYSVSPVPQYAIGVRVRFKVETYEFKNGGFIRDVQFEVGNIGSQACQDAVVEIPGAESVSVGSLQPGETKIVSKKIPFASMLDVMKGNVEASIGGKSVDTTVTLSEPSRLLRDLFAPFFIPSGVEASLPHALSSFSWSRFAEDSSGVYMLIEQPKMRDYLARLVGCFPMSDSDAAQARINCEKLLKLALQGDAESFAQLQDGIMLPTVEVA